jgi:hypothetical protein
MIFPISASQVSQVARITGITTGTWTGFFKTGLHFVAQASLELTILLPPPPECWDSRCAQLIRILKKGKKEEENIRGRCEQGRSERRRISGFEAGGPVSQDADDLQELREAGKEPPPTCQERA